MKALDLYCRAGGAGEGLRRAGFSVIGVDLEPQPENPGPTIVGDALEVLLEGYSLIWASPPCQFRTAYARRPGHGKPSPNLIGATRERLIASGTPYIIENIEGARSELRNPVMLCGSMFGLDVRRHRLFECSFPVPQPKCHHERQLPRFPPASNRLNLRRTVEVGVWRIPLDVQRRAMGIDWMNRENLSQAIPPAYSEYLAGFVQ